MARGRRRESGSGQSRHELIGLSTSSTRLQPTRFVIQAVITASRVTIRVELGPLWDERWSADAKWSVVSLMFSVLREGAR